MNHRKLSFMGLLFIIAAVTIFSVGSATVVGAHDDDDDHDYHRVAVVDDNLACPGAQYSSIQAAVNAEPAGTLIKVCPGVYNEQVRVNKTMAIRGVSFNNENAAIIRPAPAVANTTSTSSGAPIAAIILAENASLVALDNLTVDGSLSGINACAPNLIGVYYRNASGIAHGMAIRNIRLGVGLEGCQSGNGVLVQSSPNRRSNVAVLNSSIHDYQKSGITANEPGTDVWVRGNAVTGIGPSVNIAQNGIQIGFGAKGRIEENSVINHIYSLCVSTDNCAFSSADILIFESNNVKVTKNNVGKSQTNIYVIGNGAEVKENTVFDTDVFDGIALFGNNNRVQGNTIFNSDESGVFVQGNNNRVEHNTINEAPIGILEFAPSSGNDFSPNRFYNTNLKVVTAASGGLTNTLLGNLSGLGGRQSSPTRP